MARELTSGGMRAALAAELDAVSFDYDPPLVSAIVAAVIDQGVVRPGDLAKLATSTYLTRNGAERSDVEAVIARALADVAPKAQAPTTVTIRGGDTAYNVQVSSQAHVGTLNVGPGGQIVVEAGADRDALLAGVSALVAAGLRGEWDPAAAQALADALGQRDDVTMADVQATTAEVVRQERPKQSRVRAFLEKVAVGGLGGALGTGIAAGAGEVIQQLPL